MMRCDDLPLEVMSNILALVTAKTVRTDWSRKDSDANITYLQRMARYTSVCKKWNILLWQNHPETICVKPSSPLVNLLHKIPFLSKLTLEVGFSAVQRDLNIFIDNLCAKIEWTCFADVLPYLKHFELASTFKNDNRRALYRNIMKMAPDFGPMDPNFERDMLITDFATHGTLDDDVMFVLPSSKEKYTLQRFVRFPEGMRLICRTVPHEMLNIAILKLDQPSYVNDKDVRFLKRATHLQSFQCSSLYCDRCSVGNSLTVKLLQYLPPTLLELKLGSSPEFTLPNRCRWPPGLNKLLIRGIQFCAPSAGILPNSLQHLGIDFSNEVEDGMEYPFDEFDMTSLPRGLKCLEVIGIDAIKIIGTAPPALQTVITDDVASFDRHSFPLSCNFVTYKRTYNSEGDGWNF